MLNIDYEKFKHAPTDFEVKKSQTHKSRCTEIAEEDEGKTRVVLVGVEEVVIGHRVEEEG